MFFRKKTVKENIKLAENTDTTVSDFDEPKVETEYAESSHKAIIEYMDGSKEEVPYYWAEGHGGIISLTSTLKDGSDKITEYDLKGNVKSLLLA